MIIKRYQESSKSEWNGFVLKSRVDHFMFHRDYMDYHSDRFNDSSLMFYKKSKLVACFPATRSNNKLVSHAGLTFGGFLISKNLKTSDLIEMVALLKEYCLKNGINIVLYKAIPYIYHKFPSQEDLYALHQAGATIVRRDVSTTVDLKNKIKYQERRARSIKKAKKRGFSLNCGDFLEEFWSILSENLLLKFNKEPVHSFVEIKKLKDRFPNNIKLYTACFEGDPIAGILVFECQDVVHAQYIAANELGKEFGALDYLFNELISEVYKEKKYFDFGISTEKAGSELNRGLIDQKEGFGGRAIVHDFYELEIE